jgi:hypothetical protein
MKNWFNSITVLILLSTSIIYASCDAKPSTLIKGNPIPQELSVETLINQLDNPGAVENSIAYKELVKRGTDAVIPLLSALEDGYTDANKKLCIALALGDIKDERAVVPLVSLLVNTAQDRFHFDIKLVKRAIIKLGPISTEAVIALLMDNDNQVRESAIRILGEIKDVRAVLPLYRLKTTDVVERALADEAIVTIGAPAVKPLMVAYGRGATDILAKIGSPAVEELIVFLNDTDLETRKTAALTLSQISDNRASEALIQRLKASDLDIVFYINEYYIGKGVDGTEDILIDTLNELGGYGYTEGISGLSWGAYMAQRFINSGNTKLMEAGRKWAIARGYTIQEVERPGGVTTWGSTK